MKRNQSGFGVLGIILILAVLILVGGAVVVVYKNNHEAKKVTTTSTTKTYTDPSHAYNVTYPSDWSVQNQSLAGLAESVQLLDGMAAVFTPQNLHSTNEYRIQILITAYQSNISAYFNGQVYGPGVSHSQQNLTINGYQAVFHQDVLQDTPISGESYTDDTYAVYHNGVTVVFYFRQSEVGQGDLTFNGTSLLPEYTALVKTTRFLN